MLFSVIVLLCLVFSFYYDKKMFLFILGLVLLFYNLFLYQCFYDNLIISNWIQGQDITSKENIDYQVVEFKQNQILYFTLSTVLILFGVGYFVIKNIKKK
ncbi:hypothetical protein Yalta_081 [Yalta virus]|nr:hypothetical protein Yalta_081 [Yalta virus]